MHRGQIVFTALGGAVNVASRLQGMTKDLGCEVLLSEEVCKAGGLAPDASATREVPIRGRDRLMTIRCVERASLLSGMVVKQ